MKTINIGIRLSALCAAMLIAAPLAYAGVSPQEAEKLKGNELTPMGSERAGNADGSIPAWDGGLTGGSYDGKGKRSNPFADEKPLYSVTAQNMGEYEKVLTAGTKAMLQKFPDTYRIDVYPSHRTFAAPQAFYDNTFANATRATAADNPGHTPSEIFGGVPFPFPADGAQVMWNHLLHWRGYAFQQPMTNALISADGRNVTTAVGTSEIQMPYYDPKSDLETFKGKLGRDYWLFRMVNDGPPIRAKEAIIGRENLQPDQSRTWVYLTGQRRVRMLPTACCDTPTPAAAGVAGFDDLQVWLGRLDRFDWKLVGKKEMLIPYNANKSQLAPSTDELLMANHMNPDYVRWELHRVYVVEATLRGGQRHTASKGTYYIDEDSWRAVAGERYDAKGNLWKVLFNLPVTAPELPGFVQGPHGFYDLVAGTWYASNLESNHQGSLVIKEGGWPDSHFLPASLTGSSLR
ncbi:DUF1329 domain-containing protein [Pseudomonas sp. SA3-5]|uniref:DUF1329 domain-containing protein n=1 Tax=Pseudomonas aestuarii TaxID=3018340 RepID=A0ABT4XM27_9PSED|nr:DUF1329 domain-containing protein [Pseudomonas aestuarii]MDA7089220.1 DUF1329 domain-containing protein [Pseudomonas aestuarii]